MNARWSKAYRAQNTIQRWNDGNILARAGAVGERLYRPSDDVHGQREGAEDEESMPW